MHPEFELRRIRPCSHMPVQWHIEIDKKGGLWLRRSRLLRALAQATVAALLLAPALPAAAASRSRSVSSGDSSCRRIALTFDAEIIPSRTRGILAALARHDARSTWFLLGASVSSHPDIAREIAAAHEIGNHSSSHPWLTSLGDEDISAELAGDEQTVVSVTGTSPRPLFRPPYGDVDARVRSIAGGLGYDYTVMWSIDTHDWTGADASTIAERILDGAYPGAIALMHGSGKNTAAGVEEAMVGLEARGYQFEPVSVLLGLSQDNRDYGGHSYIVQGGDSFEGIAHCWNTTAARLRAGNGILPSQGVGPGTKLTIPFADQVNLRMPGGYISLPGGPLRPMDGVTMVPLRAIAPYLGITVAGAGGQYAAVSYQHALHLHVGRKSATANGEPAVLPLAPVDLSGDVLVPLRALCDALGVPLHWDGDSRTISLTPVDGGSWRRPAGRS